MIMQWKKQGTDFVTTWQSIQFVLFENPVTKRWELLSNGKHVRESWASHRRAMEQIDARQQQLIKKAATVPGFNTQLVELREQVGARGR